MKKTKAKAFNQLGSMEYYLPQHHVSPGIVKYIPQINGLERFLASQISDEQVKRFYMRSIEVTGHIELLI